MTKSGTSLQCGIVCQICVWPPTNLAMLMVSRRFSWEDKLGHGAACIQDQSSWWSSVWPQVSAGWSQKWQPQQTDLYGSGWKSPPQGMPLQPYISNTTAITTVSFILSMHHSGDTCVINYTMAVTTVSQLSYLLYHSCHHSITSNLSVVPWPPAQYHSFLICYTAATSAVFLSVIPQQPLQYCRFLICYTTAVAAVLLVTKFYIYNTTAITMVLPVS
jgi:hypothetical protein